MKKKIFITFAIACVMALSLALTGCAQQEKWKFEDQDATAVAEQLKSDGVSISQISTVAAEDDSNSLLGRPNSYTSKCYFIDSKLADKYASEITDNQYMTDISKRDSMADYGGTIEVFENESDATTRMEYLTKLSDKSLGAFGVNQYIYQNKTIVLRVTYNLTADQAAEYETALNDDMIKA